MFHHRHDFIETLRTVCKPNLKLKAVLSDIESKEVIALHQCLGLFYLKLTGLYWDIITCWQVPYLELSEHVMKIKDFLTDLQENTEMPLDQNSHWTTDDPLGISHVPCHRILTKSLFCTTEETRELLLRALPVIATAMLKCVNKNLEDFLPGGKFFNANSRAEHSSSFAPTTNSSCEHHFGDLDASQRRRPRASYHHHSSVQYLKETVCLLWSG